MSPDMVNAVCSQCVTSIGLFVMNSPGSVTDSRITNAAINKPFASTISSQFILVEIYDDRTGLIKLQNLTFTNNTGIFK